MDTFGIVQDFADLHGDMSTPLYRAIMNVMLSRQHEEIVRCRDCKHFTPKGTHKFKNGKTNNDYCTYIRGWMLQITPDGFCAWAERKEDGDDQRD